MRHDINNDLEKDKKSIEAKKTVFHKNIIINK